MTNDTKDLVYCLTMALVTLGFAVVFGNAIDRAAYNPHQPCTTSQLASLASAKATLQPNTCDTLSNYLAAFDAQTPIANIADWDRYPK